MGTSSDKHARQEANRRAGDALRAEHESHGRRRSLMFAALTLVVVAVVIGVVIAFTGKGDDGSDTGITETTVAPDNTGSTPAPEGEAVELPEPSEGTTLSGETPCPPDGGSDDRVQKFAGPPPTCIEDGASYTAMFDTSEGTFSATLDPETAPVAVNNFVVLARYHFFDGVPFHRIVPGFVIQGGDGDGAPWGNNDLGYSFEDELPEASSAYTDYSLAMANSGPNTNGSQFFVILPGGGSALQPLYTRFGEVVEGREVIDAIGEYSDGSEQPTKAVIINSVKIETDQ